MRYKVHTKKAYFYPNLKDKSINPYFDDFITSISKYLKIVNEHKPTSIGIIDIFKYILKVNIIFLNFPEEIVDKRYGLLQVSIFVLIIIPLIKFRGVKVIWTLHNRQSHYEDNSQIKSLLFKYMMRQSNLIITHARDGLEIIDNKVTNSKSKNFFFPHPVTKINFKEQNSKIEYDYIIWGTIASYKGVDAFLKYAYLSKDFSKKRIIIAGKIINDELKDEIFKYLTPNIKLINRFVDNDELIKYITSSSIILFPYNHKSILASGALTYSINFGRPIIGPNVGAFKDLVEYRLVFTYDEYDQIKDINITGFNPSAFIKYFDDFSWENFASKLFERICSLTLCRR